MNFYVILHELDKLFEIYQPWIAFLGIIFTFTRIYQWARNQKTGALIIGLLVQMILPDPKVEQTIEIIQQEKPENKQSQRSKDDKNKNSEKRIK